MAITMRHGPYSKFDPQKLRTAEITVVTEGDPHASDGKAIYQCFSPGDVKRMATYEDMVDQIDEAGGEVIDNHIEEKTGAALKACENATKAAQDAKTNADKVVSSANTAASSASTAANTANKAAETASKAAEDCKNLIDEKHVAEIEKAAQQSLMADAVDGTVTGKTVTDLPENTAPADTDDILIGTEKVIKRLSLSNLFVAIRDKLLTWTYEKLNTANKTIPGSINELNTKLTNLVTTKSYDITVSGNNTAIVSNEKNIAVEGYVPMAIAGFQTSTADRTLKCMISGNTLYTTVEKRNYSSGRWSSTLTIKITYIKNFS